MVFAIVWKLTPELAEGVLQLRSYAAQLPEATPPAAKEPAPAARKPAKQSARNRVTVPTAPLPVSIPAYSEEPIATPVIENLQPVRPTLRPSEFKVATENAELYSSNSPNSNIVRKLNRGDIVELQFKVNNAGPEWMFVTIANPKGSGFLRSETVSKQDSVDQQASR